MVTIGRLQSSRLRECPHCGSNFLVWDERDHEPYCFNCGWRRGKHISAEQARDHFRRESDFWANLFAAEKDPDDVNNAVI